MKKAILTFCLLQIGMFVIPHFVDSRRLPEGVAMEKDLVYRRIGDRELKLDLYWHPDAGGPAPVIVWIHGGAWRGGSKDNPRRALAFVGKGYAVASVAYRLSQEAIFPAQIEDCKAAVRWLRANAAKYKLDPERFGAWGSSAGGHLVALLGTAGGVRAFDVGDYLDQSSRVQAVCDWFGPTDFLRMNDVPGRIDHDASDSPESRLIGGPIQDNRQKVARANPITYVTPDDPPFLVMHGAQDFTVLKNQSELLNEALQKAGVACTFIVIDDAGHGFKGHRGRWEDILKPVEAFFDEHLKGEEGAWGQGKVAHNPWVTRFRPGTAGMRYAMFVSGTTGDYYGYSLYLPPGYGTDRGKRYPVMYWLHGRNGDPSRVSGIVARLDRAIREGRCPEMIVVGPTGLRQSMYCDARDGTFPVETAIVRDLIPHVDATYRTVPRREMRAVDGFSMGGFGAAHLGFRHPDLFGVVSIMGAAMHRAAFIRDHRPGIFKAVFGGDLDYCRANTPWTLAAQHADAIRGRTKIRLYVGERDGRLRQKNRDFHTLLERLNIPHEFGVVPGAGHNPAQVYDHFEGDPFAFYRTAFAQQDDRANQEGGNVDPEH